MRPLIFLPASKPSSPPLIGGAHGLAVEDRRAWRGLAADALAIGHHQRMMNPVPDAFPLPAAEIVVDRLPRWEIVWQQPPAATGSKEVEDRVHKLPRRRLARSSSRLRLRDHRLDQRPLTISQVGGIGQPYRRLLPWHRQRLTRSDRHPMNHAEPAKGILLKHALKADRQRVISEMLVQWIEIDDSSRLSTTEQLLIWLEQPPYNRDRWRRDFEIG